MPNNPFHTNDPSKIGPGWDYLPVTPSNTNNLEKVALSLYVEDAGAVVFVPVGNPEVTRTVNVASFGFIICGVLRVMATGTTATGIHAIVSR